MISQLKLRTYRSGSTITYFSTGFEDNPDFNTYELQPSFVITNSMGQLVNSSSMYDQRVSYDFNFSGGNKIWLLKEGENIYEEVNSTLQPGQTLITGFSFSQQVDKLSPPSQDKQDQFYNTPSLSSSTSSMIYEVRQVDDMYVDVKLNRTFGVLDTLKIKNSLINSWTDQEAETGVVFGRLEAVQKIEDEEGNRVRIPLRGVPIGIFNPSDEFPQLTSTDRNGDRIRLSLKESSGITQDEQYFNDNSVIIDYNTFLTDLSQFGSIPEHFKYVTYTDENGEFILYNIPVGPQTIMFEVNLLKQGLTRDEVALNFFPYPTEENPLIDTVPHFFFRQIPIDVVPAWGTLQTGYTEVDMAVNLDLRKWATYYIPPICFDAGDDQPSTIEQMMDKGTNAPLVIKIKDMSIFSPEKYEDSNNSGYKDREIQAVELHDIRDRFDGQQLEWNNEFSQVKRELRFFKDDFQAFKLPANMYDPSGFKTDKDGIPIESEHLKGVWLSGYQFKMFYLNENDVYRTTGYHRSWNPTASVLYSRDNFHLNNGAPEGVENSANTGVYGNPDSIYPGSSEGSYFFRKWTPYYPSNYSIPRAPTDIIIPEPGVGSPKYSDGDMVGLKGAYDAGGFGLQMFKGYDNSFTRIVNEFSQDITKSYVYKYERWVAWHERYANGFRTKDGPSEGTISFVVGGEQWQRLEAGYGYWLKPEGWPRVIQGDHDRIHTNDLAPNGDYVNEDLWGRNEQLDSAVDDMEGDMWVTCANIDGRKIRLRMDQSAGLDNNRRPMKDGGFDIYRIINPTPTNLANLYPPIIPKYVEVHFQKFNVQRGKADGGYRPRIGYYGANNNSKEYYFSDDGLNGYNKTLSEMEIEITDLGDKPEGGTVFIGANTTNSITIPKAGSVTITTNQINFKSNDSIITLEANYGYDYNESSYVSARYRIKFKNINIYKTLNLDYAGSMNLNGVLNINTSSLNVGPSNQPIKYYMISEYKDFQTNYKVTNNSAGCSNAFTGLIGDCVHNIKVNGALLMPSGQEATHLQTYLSTNALSSTDITCSGYITLPTGDIRYLIPYKVN